MSRKPTTQEVLGYVGGILDVSKDGHVDRSLVEKIYDMLAAIEPSAPTVGYVTVPQVFYWAPSGTLFTASSTAAVPPGAHVYSSTVDAYRAKGQTDGNIQNKTVDNYSKED